jgi:hypothetical protein
MNLGRCARLVLLSGALSATTGCLSMGTVQTASTLGKGNFQIAAEPGIYGANSGSSGAPAGAQDPIPHFDVAFRYGVTDRFDIGVRSGWSLFELQTKFLLTPPEAETLAISVAPTLGGIFLGSGSGAGTTSVTYFNLAVPVLFGIKHFRANEFVFGPRFNNMVFALNDSTGSAVVYLFGVGGTIGYQFAIGEIFKILPEIAINVPVAASASVGGAAIAGAGFGGVIWQVKVGLMFGRSGKRPTEPTDVGPPPPMPPPEPLTRPPEPIPMPPPELPPPAPISDPAPGE